MEIKGFMSTSRINQVTRVFINLDIYFIRDLGNYDIRRQCASAATMSHA